MSQVAEWENVHRAVHWGTTPERNFVEFAKRLPRHSWVLELGCGAGAQAVWLAEQGHRVIALDASKSAIERLQKRCTNKDLMTAVNDIRNLQWLEDILSKHQARFDCILDVCCLQHLEEDDANAVVQRARHWLRTGGVFWSKQVIEPFDRSLNRVSFVRPTELRALGRMFKGYGWSLKMVNEVVRTDNQIWHVIVEAVA